MLKHYVSEDASLKPETDPVPETQCFKSNDIRRWKEHIKLMNSD